MSGPQDLLPTEAGQGPLQPGPPREGCSVGEGHSQLRAGRPRSRVSVAGEALLARCLIRLRHFNTSPPSDSPVLSRTSFLCHTDCGWLWLSRGLTGMADLALGGWVVSMAPQVPRGQRMGGKWRWLGGQRGGGEANGQDHRCAIECEARPEKGSGPRRSVTSGTQMKKEPLPRPGDSRGLILSLALHQIT